MQIDPGLLTIALTIFLLVTLAIAREMLDNNNWANGL